MGSVRNITVTDARLKEALHQVTNTSRGNSGTASQVVSDSCTLLEAQVVKWYIGVDKIILLIGDEEVEAKYNYPFINKDFIISVLPEGDVVDDSYIEPEDTIAHVLKSKDDYLVLGFLQDNSTRSVGVGEILLQAGDNCISVCPDFINITSNALFVNGRKVE